MAFSQTLKYNSKYKQLYVSSGTNFEFEGTYKLDKTKVIFTGKLLSSENDVIDKETGHTITLPVLEIITFELFTEDTKLTIKDKEYTFKSFDSFLLLFAHLTYLDIGENDPFKGYLDFGLNPNYLEILSNGVDDFGKPVTKKEIHDLISNKCHIRKLESLSFELPANQGNKSFQNFKVSEYQRLSDRYKFFTEKLGIINPDEHDIFSIAELINERTDDDDCTIIDVFNLLLSK